MENYTFNQHRHNYAVWTAARAVQRGFTGSKTINIKNIIESSNLKQFAEDNLNYTREAYKQFHIECSEQLMIDFGNISVNQELSYGRAAKIIAIYLKTSVILCGNGECSKSKIIHPPIDNILLIQLSNNGLGNLKKIKWTQLNKKKYWSVASQIEDYFGKLDWTLEKYWSPER